MRVDPTSFEAIYRTTADPWAFAHSPYELDRYDTIITSLGATRYQRCFEPACSIGVLTARLAARADAVVACDPSPTAIARARAALTGADNVELRVAAVPEWWPAGAFDLIVLSELGYYWDLPGWNDLIRRCRSSLAETGEVIAVHWLGSSPDHILDGRTVHRELVGCFGPSQLHLERHDHSGDARAGFVLDRWRVGPDE